MGLIKKLRKERLMATPKTLAENKNGDKYSLDSDGNVNSYHYLDRERRRRSFELTRDKKDNSIKEMKDEHGNVLF